MTRLNPTTAPQIRIDVYLTEALHKQMEAECGHCLCSKTAFVRNAVAKEIAARQMRRNAAANNAILAGQLSLDDEHGR